MKSFYGQYPEIYSDDDAHYTYYFDSGARVTLIAGEDGVTEEWIRTLKQEHRKEYNMLRQGRNRKPADQEGGSLRTVSLDRYMDEVGDEGQALADPSADIEGNYIAAFERSERRERIRRALNSLAPEQRELLIDVRVKKVPLKEEAQKLGISAPAVIDRLSRIDKKLRKISP